MKKLSFGIASYGTQTAEWWQHLAYMMATLGQYDIELGTIHTSNSMNAATNRNAITDLFLKTDTEWLLWIDTDNNIPIGGIKRLMDTGKRLVCGLYYQKTGKHLPVAYWQLANNRYKPIKDWRRGELLPIEMAGMGATLVHRSVYEEIEKQFVVIQNWTGGTRLVHKDDLQGELPKDFGNVSPRVVDGVYMESVIQPDHKVEYFPHYIFEYGHTEDVPFFRNACRIGIQPFVDTSVEVLHLTSRRVMGKDYREAIKKSTVKVPQTTEYIDVQIMEAEQ